MSTLGYMQEVSLTIFVFVQGIACVYYIFLFVSPWTKLKKWFDLIWFEGPLSFTWLLLSPRFNTALLLLTILSTNTRFIRKFLLNYHAYRRLCTVVFVMYILTLSGTTKRRTSVSIKRWRADATLLPPPSTPTTDQPYGIDSLQLETAASVSNFCVLS